MYEMGQAICTTVALFPGSSPAFCRILYKKLERSLGMSLYDGTTWWVQPESTEVSTGQSKVRHEASF